MKLGSQNRLNIPKFILDNSDLKEEYYWIYKSSNNFLLSNDKEGKVLAKGRIDSKGRIFVPKEIVDFFENKKIIIYLEDGKVGILCFEEDA